MKATYIFLATISFSIFINAQQSELLNKTWNLEKVVINNSDYYFPNSITTINAIADFSTNSFVSHICNTLNADISYNENNIITFLGSSLTLGSCPTSGNDEYNIFEDNYFGQFFGGNTSNGIYSTYTYQIDHIGNDERLILTNPNGNTAIYWVSNLGVFDSSFSEFNIYPNPVDDILKINSKLSIINIEIYDIQGKLVLNKLIENKNFKNFDVDITSVSKGVHLVIIKDEKNKKSLFTHKIIKK